MTGSQRAMTADVEWTFPLEFVEVVWGDGQHTDRQVISATGLPAFGRHRFQIPFNAKGKKWVRFAAWDSAGDGALVFPVVLDPSLTVRFRILFYINALWARGKVLALHRRSDGKMIRRRQALERCPGCSAAAPRRLPGRPFRLPRSPAYVG